MEQCGEGDVAGMKSFHISTKGTVRSLFRTAGVHLKVMEIIMIQAVNFDVLIFAYCLMLYHIHLPLGAQSEQPLNKFINFIKKIYDYKRGKASAFRQGMKAPNLVFLNLSLSRYYHSANNEEDSVLKIALPPFVAGTKQDFKIRNIDGFGHTSQYVWKS